jgi:acetylglutamate kinase
MKPLNIFKIGGQLLEDETILNHIITQISTINEACIVIHGGGKLASHLATQLHIPQQLIDGRRITDAATLDIAIMVYAGLINKKVVAKLQAQNINALGLSGADLNCIQSVKRAVGALDFGWVGDTHASLVNTDLFKHLLHMHIQPVLCPLTWDGQGQLLNTNADAIAAAIAIALSNDFNVRLRYCFEKKGVLLNQDDSDSCIPIITQKIKAELIQKGIINAGMLPKIDFAFQAAQAGVEVYIGSYEQLQATSTEQKGTLIQVQ